MGKTKKVNAQKMLIGARQNLRKKMLIDLRKRKDERDFRVARERKSDKKNPVLMNCPLTACSKTIWNKCG